MSHVSLQLYAICSLLILLMKPGLSSGKSCSLPFDICRSQLTTLKPTTSKNISMQAVGMFTCRCSNLEPYALERVSDSLIDDYPGGSWNTTMSLAEYYLYNQGNNFTVVFSQSFGVNLPDIQGQLQQAKTQYIQVNRSGPVK